MKKQKWYSQTVEFETVLFGKQYFWMRDVDGTLWLARAEPVYQGVSVGSDGTETPIQIGWEPKAI